METPQQSEVGKGAFGLTMPAQDSFCLLRVNQTVLDGFVQPSFSRHLVGKSALRLGKFEGDVGLDAVREF